MKDQTSSELLESLKLLSESMTIIPCTRCDGTGKRLVHPDEACHVCAGAGEIVPEPAWPQWLRRAKNAIDAAEKELK